MVLMSGSCAAKAEARLLCGGAPIRLLKLLSCCEGERGGAPSLPLFVVGKPLRFWGRASRLRPAPTFRVTAVVGAVEADHQHGVMNVSRENTYLERSRRGRITAGERGAAVFA
ncbi:hypothetical protein FQA47_005957 [Oryzias melastigma]|uniref:Uncharacterized protein n=1 Tax=Oryzias melastigma TaxID=30732 RepID=A0A834CDM0_ORYME|nr:hypothetical protein FQA47_005957 [Oryzias melastigma]